MPVCPTGLPHLAVEVIQKIGDYLSLRDLKSLRLVCSWLNFSVEPIVLSCVVLDVFNHTPSATMHQLETLANQRTRAPEFTRKLKIANLAPRYNSSFITQCVQFLMGEPSADAVEAGMRKYLVRGISSLKRVESIIWTMDQHDPTWTSLSVCDALISLPFLRDIQIIFPKTNPPSPLNGLHFDQLCQLQRISLSGACGDYQSLIIDGVAEAIAKSPLLAHLDVDYPYWLYAPPLQDFFSKLSPDMHLHLSHLAVGATQLCLDSTMLPHLYALRSLELFNIAPEDDPRQITGRRELAQIYATLAREHIFLSCIVIDDVFPTFLDYLSLYSGTLVELRILHLNKFMPWEELDALAERFYASVLPKHIDSLEILDISPTFACRWCFDPQDCLVLSQSRRLSSLRVTFAPTQIWHAYPDPDEYEYGFDHAVSSMMQLSLTLQCLTDIHIDVAKPQGWRMYYFTNRHHGALAKRLDDFANTIRLGIRNFSFPSDEKPSFRPLPMIEVEAQLR